MIRPIIGHIIRFAFLLLVQGLVINRLDIADGMVLPFIYIFALLMLPFETPRSVLLIIGLFYGLCMDAFTNTIGMHASACVTLAFAQGLVVRFLSPREGYDFGQSPTIQSMGLSWYLTYAFILTLVHHLWLFYIEVFRFSDFGGTLLKAILSTIATVVFMVIGQYLIFTQKRAST